MTIILFLLYTSSIGWLVAFVFICAFIRANRGHKRCTRELLRIQKISQN